MTPFTIITGHPVADGQDTLHPHGSRISTSRCVRWNQLVFALLGGYERVLNVLDLGCGGGNWVRDALDYGHEAIGIDGCPWSRDHRRAEWATIPERLFTADITRPFSIKDGMDNHVMFDLITCWDTLEHIPKDGLPCLLGNVKDHLKLNGLFICTVNPLPYERDGIKYHATVETGMWWLDLFMDHGLFRAPHIERYFAGHYVRGPKHPIGGGIPFVLSVSPPDAPIPPNKGLVRSMLDWWLGSLPQRCLKYAVVGPDQEHR